jgi:hypothetical protein
MGVGVRIAIVVYPKSKREDLSAQQKQMLRKIAEGFK